MKLPLLKRLSIAICGVLSVLSCQALSDMPTPSKIEPKVLLSEMLGPTLQNGATAVWLTSLNDLRSAWPELSVSTPLRGTDLTLEKFDFSTDGLLLISMGEMPTGGYSLSLESEDSDFRNETARMVVRWTKPDRGRMVIQMLTRPCLLVQLPKRNFKQIDVVDEKGILRARISI